MNSSSANHPAPFIVAILFFVLSGFASASDERGIWLLVDTEALVLSIMRDNNPLVVYRNISIGRNGADVEKRRGDDKTPLGNYQIRWINTKSRYHRFFGISYPSFDDAKRALDDHAIDMKTYHSLVRADVFSEIPPQNTVLGGQIGIHGLGRGDPRIHDALNWTHGCIALTNNQIDGLSRWIKKGTVVKIR